MYIMYRYLFQPLDRGKRIGKIGVDILHIFSLLLAVVTFVYFRVGLSCILASLLVIGGGVNTVQPGMTKLMNSTLVSFLGFAVLLCLVFFCFFLEFPCLEHRSTRFFFVAWNAPLLELGAVVLRFFLVCFLAASRPSTLLAAALDIFSCEWAEYSPGAVAGCEFAIHY